MLCTLLCVILHVFVKTLTAASFYAWGDIASIASIIIFLEKPVNSALVYLACIPVVLG